MNDDDLTDLRCSRCGHTLTTYPGDLLAQPTIDTDLALDLIRAAIRHGYTCQGKDNPDE